ncbi:MFS superfamily sulfate permease-like transporter [Sporosarcina sp. JAI121]|nr:MFS superfamily sulfate permease-like transporter [Sporosarcina sp. JAI121]
MSSVATDAMAVAMVLLVNEHESQYLFAATILTGMLLVLLGVLKIARFMKFIHR